VTVNVPVYNEDPALLDRCLYSLVNQVRPVQVIDVVDDGSSVGYSAIREYWEGYWPGGRKYAGTASEMRSKKFAQSVTFAVSRKRTSLSR
jgi:hyaluronan synthase